MTVRRPLSVEDWMGIFRRRKWQLVVPAILCAVGGLLVSFLLPKQYTSHTRVLVESPVVPDDYVKPVVSDDVNRRLASMQGEILSRTHLQSLIEQDDLYQQDWNRVPMEVLVDRLRKSINVASMAPTPGTLSDAVLGFNIDVTLDQAKMAQQVCSQIASMFKSQNLEQRQQQSEDTTQFFDKQLSDAKAKLDDQDAKLAAFQNQYLGAQPADEQTNLTMLAGLTPQLEAATQSLNEAQENKAFSESMLSQQLAELKSSSGVDPQSLQQQLNDLQSQLMALRARYTDKHPDVIKLEGEIADLQKKMQTPAVSSQAKAGTSDVAPDSIQVQQLRAQINQAETAITEKKKEQADLQQQIKAVQGRIQLTPMVQEQYSALTRDRQTALDFYNDLMKKRDDAQMATDLERRQEGGNFRVLDPPSLPETPSFPNRQLFVLGGLMAGLALGAGLVRIAELRDKSLRQPRDVEMLLGIPTLAVISSRNPAERASAPASMAPLFTTAARKSRTATVR
jgi:polysaccharide chain length determinant protein (PEP-CTERM system associated)